MLVCGIVGYIGINDAAPILLNSLKRMEYRGYDSAGIAIMRNGIITVVKDAGKVKRLEACLNELKGASIGIAHTRWATHGGVSKENAHPHLSCNGEVAIVHNGIIENYLELKEELVKEGHIFTSQTDSEVIAHLIEREINVKKDIKKAFFNSIKRLKGSFAIVVMVKGNGNILLGARKDSPLVVGLSNNGTFLASDVLAFIEHTDKVIFLDNYEYVITYPNNVKLYTFKGEKIERLPTHVAWEASDIERKDFAHFTIKEIYEQKVSVRNALIQDSETIKRFANEILNSSKVILTACGTSYHAALVTKYLYPKLAKIYCEVILASEIEHILNLIDKETLIIAISQSGETADVLNAIRLSKKNGAKILSIVNNVTSTLVRESDNFLSINVGPEIGVAATKSFTGQLALLYLIAANLANIDELKKDLLNLANYVEETIKLEKNVKEVAKKYKANTDFYFIGRGLHYPIALEGALKLKELSYVHAEGMAAGELKHGTLALISEGTPIVAINPFDSTYNDTLSNISEMRARGGVIIGVSNKESKLYNEMFKIPTINNPLLYPIIEIIPLQMLAYYIAIERGKDPDYPRNLAKSVTVK
jgi:glucosamine--fructose-6-phosphate aminotransferase (isomerizing)